MTLPNPGNEMAAAKQKLHELNSKVLSDPSKKLLRIKEFYAEQTPSDTDLADIALIIHSIALAGADTMISNQTTHVRAATPIFIVGMVFAGLACFAIIVIGGYAIYKNQISPGTELHLWGTSMSTGSVGLGAQLIGMVGMAWVLRAAFKHASFKHPPANSAQTIQNTPPLPIAAKDDEAGE